MVNCHHTVETPGPEQDENTLCDENREQSERIKDLFVKSSQLPIARKTKLESLKQYKFYSLTTIELLTKTYHVQVRQFHGDSFYR